MKVYGTTTNFKVEYNDSFPIAQKCAAAVFDVVESEFAFLTAWFGITSGFGPSNRVTVAIDRDDFGAVNYGYDSGGKISIQIQKNVTDEVTAGERTRAFFVAEFVEILMSYRNQNGPKSWDPSHSDGEGLSRFCARERFRTGYDAAFSFVEVNVWLNSPRNNFIDTPMNTDQDEPSTSASLLFIHFLHSQLNFSIPSIIQSAGATLEQTYSALTGHTNGYAALRNVIDPFYPPNTMSTATDDNIFPLLDPAHRLLTLNVASPPPGSEQEIGSGSNAVFRLGCGKRTYTFQLFSSPREAICTAKAIGFAKPSFTWRVNNSGVLPAEILEAVNVLCLVAQFDPNDPTNLVQSYQTINLDYIVTTVGSDTKLRLWCSTLVGIASVSVTLDAIDELYMPRPSELTTTSVAAQIANEELKWEQSYYADIPKCRANFLRDLRQVAAPFDWLEEAIAILETLPDPPISDLRSLSFNLARLSQFARELKGAKQSRVAEDIDRLIVSRYGQMLELLGQLRQA